MTTAETKQRLAYRPELDGVRALAVLAVMGDHIAFSVARLRPYFNGGFLGVDVFFVLSGMLITELITTDYLSSGAVSIGSFYRRRARRLLPALFTFLTFAIAYYWLVHGWSQADVIVRGLETTVVYVTTGHQLKYPLPPAVGQVWTLVVEWEFYLIWPIVLVTALRRGVSTRKIAAFAAVAVLAITGVRAGLMVADGNTQLSYYLAWLRFDELLVGCSLGLYGASKWTPNWLRTVSLVALVLAVSRVLGADTWLYEGGMLALALATAAVVQPRARPWFVDRLLRSPPLVWTGKLSYSLYLWSNLLASELPRHNIPVWPMVLAYFFGSFALASASYYLVERRFRLPSRSALSGDEVSVAPRTPQEADPQVTDGTPTVGR